MNVFYDVRGVIVDSGLVGRRVFRPEQVEKPTFPYAEVDEGEASNSDIPGWELRQIDVNVYLRKTDDPNLPRQVADLFRKLKLNGAFCRVESIRAETQELGINQTTIEVVARVPLTP